MSASRPVNPLLVAAALVLGMQLGCLGCSQGVEGEPEVRRLSAQFAAHAELVQSGAGWQTRAGGFMPSGRDPLHARVAADAPRLELSIGRSRVQVEELGASGAPRALDHALSWPRAGGDDFWVANARGVEEWLRVDRAEEPLRWRVRGASLKAERGAVYLLDQAGNPHLAVRAPAAYLPDGRKLEPALSVEGDLIVLRVDARGPALIDPEWVGLPTMGTARIEHTATLLADGRVLVVGGRDSSGAALPDAEIFDPSTGLWSPAAPLIQDSHDNNVDARWGHTATLLRDGTVLVAGGADGTRATKSAELYHPDTDSWTLATVMNQPRHDHTATRLNDGRVLVVGGDDTSDGFSINALAKAEIYDPSGAGSWSDATGSVGKHSHHAAVLLGDGRVMIAGGYNNNTNTSVTNQVQIFSTTGTWGGSGGHDMLAHRRDFTLTVLQDGRVMATGGYDNSSTPVILSSTETTTIGTGNPATWASAGTMSVGRTGHHVASLPDGNLVACGGLVTPNTWLDQTCDLYSGSSWSTTTSMNTNRAYGTATLLANGRLLVAGGESWNGAAVVATSAAEVYDEFSASASAGGSYVWGGQAAALDLTGAVVTVGGDQGAGATNSAYRWFADGGFQQLGNMNTSRTHATATRLPDNRILVVGGFNGEGVSASALTSVEVLLTDGGWQQLHDLGTARGDHSATLMPDGRVLVVGGSASNNVALDSQGLKSTEVYDWTTNTWTAGPQLNQKRHGHGAVLLPDGSVLVSGGIYTSTCGTTGTSCTSELLSSLSGSWSVQQMGASRVYGSLTLQPDGSALAAGGENSLATAGVGDSEVFRNGVWESTVAMNESLTRHAAVRLPSGFTLVAGGLNGVGSSTLATELYDPYFDTWSSGPTLAGTHVFATATVLPGGLALVAGNNSIELVDEGRGATWRPLLASFNGNASAAVKPGQSYPITGAYFTGYNTGSAGNPREAASGDTRSSASNLPLVQWERQDNHQQYQASISNWDGGLATVALPSSLQAGPGWAWVSVSGVTSTRLSVTVKLPQGSPCLTNDQCASTFCTDGVCCGTSCAGGTSDCQACSVKAGAAVDGTCGPVSVDAGVVCAAGDGLCVLPATCDGSSTTCPANPDANQGTPCDGGGSCDNAGVCQPPSTTSSTTTSGTTTTSSTTTSTTGSSASSSGSSSASSSGSTTSTTGASSASSSSSGSSASSSSSGSSSGSSSSSSSSGSSSSNSSSSGSSSSSSSSTTSTTSSTTTGSTTTSTSGSTTGTTASSTTTGGSSSGASGSGGAGGTGGAGSSGAAAPKGPATFALSGCGCQSLMDPGFASLALLLLGLRRRRR